MIGIIAAMDSEVAHQVGNGRWNQDPPRRDDFFKGKLHQKEVIAVKSGVGKVNAAMCTQISIDIFKVSSLIHVGVAGAVHPIRG